MKNQKNITGTYLLPRIIRAGWSPVVIFPVLGLLISLPLLSIIGRGPSAVLPVIVLLCVIWCAIAALVIVIASQRIVLQPESISYRTLFSRRKILFADITQVQLERVVGAGRGSRTVKYILRIEDRLSDKPLLINIKSFSKRGISIVVDAIVRHSGSVTLDEGARQLREGIFPN